MKKYFCALLIVTAAFAVRTSRLDAQSTTSISPNLSNGWLSDKHELQFDLLHRFALGPGPSHKVLNASTLGLTYGVFRQLQVGVTYASASELVLERPNEFEFSARARLVRQATGGPVDVFVQGAWNHTVKSVDAQVNIDRRFGDGRVMLAVTYLSDALNSGKGRGAVGGGVIVPLARNMALAGDVTTLFDKEEGEPVAWSAGYQISIPDTPHTLSLNISNVASRTLQGSVAGSHTTRVGFEYTIPVTLGARKTAVGGSKE